MITMIGSLKGGSGKSTVTFNLAVWLRMAGVNIGVLDLDPQATLSDVSEVRDEEAYEPPITIAHKESFKKTLGNPDFDEVLIDVGTADMAMLRKAIAACDRIVVPVPPSQADIWSTQRFLGMVREAREGAAMPEILGFINRADTHHAIRESDEAAAALLSLPGIDFVKRRLHQRTCYRRSFSEGLAVFELEPRGKAAAEFAGFAATLYPHLVR